MATKGLPSGLLKKVWKMKGTTKKNALKRAWAIHRGKKSSKSKTKKKTGSKKMTTNRKRRQFTIPAALVSGVALGFVIKPASNWDSPYEAARRGDWATVIKNYATNMIGYRADTGAIFDTTIGMKGLWALIGGFVIHKVASMIGLNRALGRARIPYLRV